MTKSCNSSNFTTRPAKCGGAHLSVEIQESRKHSRHHDVPVILVNWSDRDVVKRSPEDHRLNEDRDGVGRNVLAQPSLVLSVLGDASQLPGDAGLGRADELAQPGSGECRGDDAYPSGTPGPALFLGGEPREQRLHRNDELFETVRHFTDRLQRGDVLAHHCREHHLVRGVDHPVTRTKVMVNRAVVHPGRFAYLRYTNKAFVTVV